MNIVKRILELFNKEKRRDSDIRKKTFIPHGNWEENKVITIKKDSRGNVLFNKRPEICPICHSKEANDGSKAIKRLSDSPYKWECKVCKHKWN